jgi:hypothetical protein
MDLEQRDRIVLLKHASTYGEERVMTAKPFAISKRLVSEAYQCVKANAGAAGVDEQSLEEFDRSLADNLYRIWNRMASGSYFPPPVKAVTIPKKSGGDQMLGIPTVADRIAQTVVKRALEPELEPHFHAVATVTGPANRLIRPLKSPASDVGGTIGCWSLISEVCMTTWIITC